MTLREVLTGLIVLGVCGCGASDRAGEGGSEVSAGPGMFLIRPTLAQQGKLGRREGDYVDVQVDALSEDNQVAVGTSYVEYVDDDGYYVSWVVAFRWTRQTGTSALALPGIDPNEPASNMTPVFNAMTRNASVIVGTTNVEPIGARAFRWELSRGATDLTPADARHAAANALSDDGTVVAGHYVPRSTGDEQTYEQAFVWTQATGSVAIGTLPGDVGAVPAWVKGDGSVVVGSGLGGSGNSELLFRWTRETGMTALGTLPGCDNYRITATADDVVAGNCGSAAGGQSFVWSDETGLVGLGNPTGADGSRPYAVSKDGSVVVGHTYLAGQTVGAFRWTRETGLSEALTVPGTQTTALLLDRRTMSDDGSVVVGSASNPNVPPVSFRWSSDSGFSLLDPLPGDTQAFVNGVSGDGRTIPGSSFSGAESKAILWTPEGPTRIEDVIAQNGIRAPEVNGFFAKPSGDGRFLYGTAGVPQGVYGWYLELPLPSNQ